VQLLIVKLFSGERVKSAEVRVPVSTFSSHERGLPVFKLALVICQEQYECSEYFHPLRAPRNDGQAFIKVRSSFASLSIIITQVNKLLFETTKGGMKFYYFQKI
jgi:hypothetical protein